MLKKNKCFTYFPVFLSLIIDLLIELLLSPKNIGFTNAKEQSSYPVTCCIFQTIVMS